MVHICAQGLSRAEQLTNEAEVRDVFVPNLRFGI